MYRKRTYNLKTRGLCNRIIKVSRTVHYLQIINIPKHIDSLVFLPSNNTRRVVMSKKVIVISFLWHLQLYCAFSLFHFVPMLSKKVWHWTNSLFLARLSNFFRCPGNRPVSFLLFPFLFLFLLENVSSVPRLPWFPFVSWPTVRLHFLEALYGRGDGRKRVERKIKSKNCWYTESPATTSEMRLKIISRNQKHLDCCRLCKLPSSGFENVSL